MSAVPLTLPYLLAARRVGAGARQWDLTEMLSHAVRSVTDAVQITDGEGRLLFTNAACEELFGRTGFADRTSTRISVDAILPSSHQVVEVAGRTGRIAVSISRSDVLDGQGALAFTVWVARDMTEQRRVEQALRELNDELRESRAALERLATSDALTGLPNRRDLDRTLSTELARSARYQHPVSLILLDLDHFKRVNDVHGHLAGDDVLRETAARVRATVRASDRPARFGGEELAIVLPETANGDALMLAKRLQRQIAGTQYRVAGGLTVTASFGVASAPVHGTTAAQLFAAADRALYAAKAGGRNRVEAAPVP